MGHQNWFCHVHGQFLKDTRNITTKILSWCVLSLTLVKLCFRVPKHLILIAENVVVDIELVRHGTLWKWSIKMLNIRLKQLKMSSIDVTGRLRSSNNFPKSSPLEQAQKFAWTSSWAARCWTVLQELAPPLHHLEWRGHPHVESLCDTH